MAADSQEQSFIYTFSNRSHALGYQNTVLYSGGTRKDLLGDAMSFATHY